jgi:flagellar biosynthesis/type III secretory pathway protein FliH
MTTSKPTKRKLSRSSYDQEHPIRSFRLKTKESNERLQAYLEATGSSVSDLIERALNNLPVELPDIGKIKEAEYAQGYYEGYEDGYERARVGFPYPTNLMTRRARERAIEIYKRTGKRT